MKKKILENKGIVLKRTITKITSQEGGFLNLLRTIMKAGLPLMKSVLTPLAKSASFDSIRFKARRNYRIQAGMSAVDAAIQKNIYGSGTMALII